MQVTGRWWQNFNPRSREGSDGSFWPVTSMKLYFNPRSREGSDVPEDLVKFLMQTRFQSTLP